jgi:hypothetical protein
VTSTTGSALYFAEGTTLDGFREYLLIANPGTAATSATVTYYFEDGSTPVATTVGINAQSRTTVDVAAVIGTGKTGVSVGVVSPSAIVAERSIFFDRGLSIGQVNGSSTVLGVTTPKKTWTFAEGSTLDGFQEYLTIENPGSLPAAVSVTYGIEGGGVGASSITVPAGQRRTVDVNSILGAVTGHSTVITSDQPVLVERPLYFNRAVSDDGVVINGGDSAPGADPGTTFMFAEGTVLPDFATYLTLANPSPSTSANVTITYFLTDGTTIVKTAAVAATSRRTVRVFDAADTAGIGRDVSDPSGRGVAISVTSDTPIVAERPVYFHHVFSPGGVEITDGHDAVGAAGPAVAWSFAEGSTLPGFFPFLTILNGGATPATVTVTYTPDSGAPVTRTLTVNATSRLTVQVYGDAASGGIGGEVTGFGIFVRSDKTVLVERPLYVDRSGIPGLPEIIGGSDVIGAPGS